MRRVLLATTAIVVLALPATAVAGKVKLGGKVAGAPASNVQVTVAKNRGELQKITKLKFQRVPITCADGVQAFINGRTIGSFAINGKDFTRRTRIQGTGIKNGFFRATGKFRRGGKTAKGFVRFSIKRTDGIGCGTGSVRWSAKK